MQDSTSCPAQQVPTAVWLTPSCQKHEPCAAQEAEQREAAEEAEAADPVKRLRKAVQAGLKPQDAVALLNEVAEDAGTAARMRILYQVSPLPPSADLGCAADTTQSSSCTHEQLQQLCIAGWDL